MKVSIVISVLDSHKAVDRQLRHFAAMPLADDVELIVIDDGSTPPLAESIAALNDKPRNFRLLRQDIDAEWTQPIARNWGAREAAGEYLLLTDIDHIVCRPLLDALAGGEWDCMMFNREIAIIDERGQFVQTEQAVMEYGYARWRFKRTGYKIPPHCNSFGIRKTLYLATGGMKENIGKYPNHEEAAFRRRLARAAKRREIKYCPREKWPVLYMFPNGKFTGDVDYNPFGLFHRLTRKTDGNLQWRLQKAGRFNRDSHG